MRDELLIHSYSDTNIAMLLPRRLGSGHDVFLPLKQTYNVNNLLQNIPFIYSSLEGGYYHFRFKFVFSINSIADLSNGTIALLIQKYVNGNYIGGLDRIEYHLNGSGAVSNTTDLTQEYNFEIYLNKADHFNLAFSHEVFKSIALTISVLDIKIYQIADKKESLPSDLVTTSQLNEVLENFMKKTSYENPDGTVGKQLAVSYENLKGVPFQFNPKDHTHPELLTNTEFLAVRNTILNYIEILRKYSHSHENFDVISGFYQEGQTLFFKGRRFMNYDDYLALNNAEDISELVKELSDLHSDVLNFPPEEYFYDLGNNLRWRANTDQTFNMGAWTTVLFSEFETIKGDLIYDPAGIWKFYPQVPGIYTISFFYVFDYGNDGLTEGDEYNIRYGLFRNGTIYSILDYDWSKVDADYHFKSSCQGTDRIVLKLGDYIEIKAKHNLPYAIQPPLEMSYGYINIEKCDTYGKEIQVGTIPINLA